MRKHLLSVVMLLGGAALYAQHQGGEPLWTQYIQEPQPNYYKAKKAFDAYWNDSVPKKGSGYKVFKRWEWRAIQHMDAYGNVIWPQDQLENFVMPGTPKSGPVSTGNSMGSSGGSMSACPGGGRWTRIGPVKPPHNQTSQPNGVGRIAGIAFHPSDTNSFFVCAPQGGVWKTTDNGATWSMLFGNGPVVNTIGSTALLLSYNDPDTMYLGTGDRDAGDAPGFGVLASWNGGKTWSTRNSGMGNLTIGRMAMHPKNSAIILAATNNGIYRSANSGSSWTQTLSGSAWDVVYHPANPSIVYASIGGAFYKSTDGGVTWSNITSGLPTSGVSRGMISVSAASRGYVYFLLTGGITFKGVYRSTDSGSTFSTMSTTPNILGYSETGSDANGQGWYDLDIAADPKNADVIYVAAINMWKSSNGGSNWTVCGHWVGSGGADDIHADQHAVEFNKTGNKIYAGNDGGIYYSSNGGSRWKNIGSGIQNSQIYRITQAKTNPFANAQGYQDNGSAQLQEDQFYTYYGGDGMDCQVDPSDHTYVYGSYVYGKIYRAVNKNTITVLGSNGTNGITESGGWLTPFVLREGSPSVMWAGYANVWRCDNTKTTGTISWTKLTSAWPGTITRIENSPADNKILYVIRGDGKLFRSTDATVTSPTWTDLSSSQPSGIRYIEAHPKNSNVIYCCNATNLYRSTNQGTSWTSIGTLPASSGNMNCVLLDTSAKTETIYIGSEKGVYVWDSASASVITFSSGFPVWSDVTDLDIYYSPKGRGYSRIVSSTYGMGTWKSNLYDDGNTKPKADFYAFDSTFITGAKMRLYENVAYTTTSIKWKITPYNYTYAEGTDSLSFQPVIQWNSTGLFSVRFIATNCNGSDTFSKNYWIKVFPAAANATCTNTTNWQSVNYGMGILKFGLSDNKNETGGYFDDGENLDMSISKVFRVKPSTSCTATIKTGLYNNEYVRLYLDYNNNGKFENYLGEVSTMPAAVLGTRNIVFTTPSGLKPNQGFRLRVLSDYNILDTNACKNLTYGQGEEYTLLYDKTTPYFKVSKTSACTNENLTFTDTSEGLIGQYEWDFGTGAVPATATGKGPHTVYYSSTGNKNIRLKINGVDTIRKNNYVTIISGPNPQVVLKNGSANGCEGRNITLAARSSSGGTLSVQWLKNGSNISGKTDTLLVLNNVTISDAANYAAYINNGSCGSNSSAITINVDARPIADFSIGTNPQCIKNNNFIFTNNSSISSGTITSNNWNMGDGNSQTSTNASRKYSSSGTFNVKLVITSSKGCKDSSTKSVTVYPNSVVKFTVNDSDQCYAGNNFIFTNNSGISSGSFTNDWRFGDGNTSSSTSPTKSYTTRGTYTVNLITTSNNGCKDTASKPVRIYSAPSVVFTLNNSNQCKRTNLFTTTNSSTNTDGSLSYSWNFGDGFKPSSSAPSHTYSSEGAYNIKLIATSSYGCVDSAVKSINVYPNTTVKFSVNDSDQCYSGNNFIFSNNSSISSGSFTNDWRFGDGNTSSSTSPTKSYATRGNYTVNLITTSNNGCKDTASKPVRIYSAPSVVFTLNNSNQCKRTNLFTTTNSSTNTDGSLSYSWNFGDGYKPSSSAPSHTYSSEGAYNIKLIATSSYGCVDSAVKSINVYPNTTVKFSVNDSDQCYAGNNFIFTNNSGISSGSFTNDWRFGDGNTSSSISPTKSYTARGNYNVLLITKTNNGCLDTASKPLRVYSAPAVSFSVNNNSQCLRSNLFTTSNNSTNSDGSLSYSWSFGDGFTSNNSAPVHSYSKNGNFNIRLVAQSAFGCEDSAALSITVSPQANAAFQMNDSDQCQRNNIFNFANTSAIASGSLNYSWDFGDGTYSAIASPVKVYANRGIYSVKLIAVSGAGCNDTLTKPLRVYDNPVADFSLNTTAQCMRNNLFISGNNSSVQDGTLNYVWTFGDGFSSNAATPYHSYATAGNYSVVLMVSSTYGCGDTSSVSIKIHPQVNLDFTVNNAQQCLEGNQVVVTDKSTISSGTFTYNWTFGDGGASNISQPSYTYASAGDFLLQLIAVSDNNCRDTASLGIKILDKPNVRMQVNNPIQCLKGNLFVLNNISAIQDTGIIFYWNYNNQKDYSKTLNLQYNIPGLYNVSLVAQNKIGCTATELKTLEVLPQPNLAFSTNNNIQCFAGNLFHCTNSSSISDGSLNFIWNFGDGQTSTLNSPDVQYFKSGDYEITLIGTSSAFCGDTINKKVTVLPTPKAEIKLLTAAELCLNNNEFVAISNSSVESGMVHLNWKCSDGYNTDDETFTHSFSDAGNYLLELLASSDDNCSDTQQISLNVNPSPVSKFATSGIYFCENGTVSMFDSASLPSGNLVVHWYKNDMELTDPNQIILSEYGEFVLKQIVNSDKNCTDTSETTIYVTGNPKLKFFYSPAIGCAGQTVFQFEDSSENPGGNAPIRKWNFTDSDSSERELVQRKFDTAGTYHAHLHLQNGACEADSAFTFVVLPKPTAAFIYQMEDRETVRFQALDENADITAFHWNLGDGVEADGIHCTHTYFRNDSFQTVLMVQNNSGCRDTTNNTIGIKSPNNILQNNALNFYVYPNPNNGQFTYKFEVLETQNITIDIRDILGRNIIYQKNWSSLIPGIYHETIDFNALGLAPGTYPFSIGSDTKKEVVKVIFAR